MPGLPAVRVGLDQPFWPAYPYHICLLYTSLAVVAHQPLGRGGHLAEKQRVFFRGALRAGEHQMCIRDRASSVPTEKQGLFWMVMDRPATTEIGRAHV